MKCSYCNNIYKHSSSLSKHKKLCEIRHDLNVIRSITVHCESCDIFVEKRLLPAHQKSFNHKDKLAKMVNEKIELYNTTKNGDVRELRIRDCAYDMSDWDLKNHLNKHKQAFVDLIILELISMKTLAFRLCHTGLYTKISNNDHNEPEMVKAIKTFNSDYFQVFQSTDVNERFGESISNLVGVVENFALNDSGWVLNVSLQLCIQILNIMHFGNSWIELPIGLKNSPNLLNIINKDNKCIIWFFSS